MTLEALKTPEIQAALIGLIGAVLAALIQKHRGKLAAIVALLLVGTVAVLVAAYGPICGHRDFPVLRNPVDPGEALKQIEPIATCESDLCPLRARAQEPYRAALLFRAVGQVLVEDSGPLRALATAPENLKHLTKVCRESDAAKVSHAYSAIRADLRDLSRLARGTPHSIGYRNSDSVLDALNNPPPPNLDALQQAVAKARRLAASIRSWEELVDRRSEIAAVARVIAGASAYDAIEEELTLTVEAHGRAVALLHDATQALEQASPETTRLPEAISATKKYRVLPQISQKAEELSLAACTAALSERWLVISDRAVNAFQGERPAPISLPNVREDTVIELEQLENWRNSLVLTKRAAHQLERALEAVSVDESLNALRELRERLLHVPPCQSDSPLVQLLRNQVEQCENRGFPEAVEAIAKGNSASSILTEHEIPLGWVHDSSHVQSLEFVARISSAANDLVPIIDSVHGRQLSLSTADCLDVHQKFLEIFRPHASVFGGSDRGLVTLSQVLARAESDGKLSLLQLFLHDYQAGSERLRGARELLGTVGLDAESRLILHGEAVRSLTYNTRLATAASTFLSEFAHGNDLGAADAFLEVRAVMRERRGVFGPDGQDPSQLSRDAVDRIYSAGRAQRSALLEHAFVRALDISEFRQAVEDAEASYREIRYFGDVLEGEILWLRAALRTNRLVLTLARELESLAANDRRHLPTTDVSALASQYGRIRPQLEALNWGAEARIPQGIVEARLSAEGLEHELEGAIIAHLEGRQRGGTEVLDRVRRNCVPLGFLDDALSFLEAISQLSAVIGDIERAEERLGSSSATDVDTKVTCVREIAERLSCLSSSSTPALPNDDLATYPGAAHLRLELIGPLCQQALQDLKDAVHALRTRRAGVVDTAYSVVSMHLSLLLELQETGTLTRAIREALSVATKRLADDNLTEALAQWRQIGEILQQGRFHTAPVIKGHEEWHFQAGLDTFESQAREASTRYDLDLLLGPLGEVRRQLSLQRRLPESVPVVVRKLEDELETKREVKAQTKEWSPQRFVDHLKSVGPSLSRGEARDLIRLRRYIQEYRKVRVEGVAEDWLDLQATYEIRAGRLFFARHLLLEELKSRPTNHKPQQQIGLTFEIEGDLFSEMSDFADAQKSYERARDSYRKALLDPKLVDEEQIRGKLDKALQRLERKIGETEKRRLQELQ